MVEVKTNKDIKVITDMLQKIVDVGCSCNVEIVKSDKIRTLPMNNSLHLWLALMASEMNDAGYTSRKLWEAMRVSFDIPVTMEMLKDIAKNVSFDMFKKKHTSKLTIGEMKGLYDALNRAFGQCIGISLDWPSKGSQADKDMLR